MLETSALVKHSATDSITLVEHLHDRCAYYESAQAYAKSIIAAKQKAMRAALNAMNDKLSVLQRQVKQACKLIALLKIELGEDESLIQLCEGNQSDDTTLHVRQLVLFMDEEMCAYNEDYAYNRFDYHDIEQFDEWLKQPKNLQQVIPEEKCIVVVKPRRFDKHYSSNAFENKLLNEWRLRTYILMRNGENVYRLWSEHISIGETVFLDANELSKQIELANKYNDANTIDNMTYDALKFALFVNKAIKQGMFGDTTYDMLNIEESNIKLIFDATKSMQLDDGHISFNDWHRQNIANIQVGDRVLLAKITERAYERDILDRFKREYASQYSVPELPKAGVYSVVEKCSDRKFAISYKPVSYFGDVAHRNVTFYLTSGDCVVNYDSLDLQTIEYYLSNRVERKHYSFMLPILWQCRKMLLEDIELENQFAQMLSSHVNASHENIMKAIQWWKLKNKWKRALSVDDAKAFRMIVKHLNKVV